MATSPGKETVLHLADQIRQIESSVRRVASADIPLGVNGLGELFPAKRLPAGSVVELVSGAEGAGAWTLALVLATYACGERKMLLVADHQHCFYPPAALKWGVPQRRVVIVRSPDARDALLAVAQSLRCPTVGAVVGQFDRLPERDGRRLQVAVETGGGVGILLRPASARNSPSFAAVRLLLSPLPSADARRQVRVEVLRCRGGHHGRVVIIEVDDDTGHVRAFSELAAAAGMAGLPRSPG
jgi:hypothetical protein